MTSYSATNQNDAMTSLAQGVQTFQKKIYPGQQTLFQTLASGQSPKVLFITCSDSRVDPSLITQTGPGDMFVIQNAGNLVPPHGSEDTGVLASIEYAVSVLGVSHIVVCGHSGCGAMGALLHPEKLDALPIVKQWLLYAEKTRGILSSPLCQDKSEAEKIDICIRENIAVQLGHLEALPFVAEKLASGKLSLHGWVYDIGSGNVTVYEQTDSNGEAKFIAINNAYATAGAIA
ncbi:MAG: carbonic anhydrase [Vampirovibrionales bacterium]|nr:carbonic anhydrase [Vampirovibrionales bacterium]